MKNFFKTLFAVIFSINCSANLRASDSFEFASDELLPVVGGFLSDADLISFSRISKRYHGTLQKSVEKRKAPEKAIVYFKSLVKDNSTLTLVESLAPFNIVQLAELSPQFFDVSMKPHNCARILKSSLEAQTLVGSEHYPKFLESVRGSLTKGLSPLGVACVLKTASTTFHDLGEVGFSRLLDVLSALITPQTCSSKRMQLIKHEAASIAIAGA